ncbi:MAG: hypothetical protein A2669_00450 [Candidatus Yanofskybacteria bacterium RIFCSPHIGHO2_01_FULL_48_25b]|uniref:Uncharacterized protein n=1 Tax=Candidatus Yanofskybacteria bacterium RIFCSPHIGHO2_01_FULL_48_25b TaxID=1802672 RepID=A0A1F8F238_9BACT|nr:MAG: hypothetical protein A2669_00450 [Candidatus Yanofskybacteria bacterium RIFCSPHIGHO2_01_FULL_48_25b]
MEWLGAGWEGESFSFGYIFLTIAVWDTFVAAFNVLVMPRIYNSRKAARDEPALIAGFIVF